MVIEHNLEVIKTADWVIDLGPEGGDGGGEIVATGTPEEIVKEERSYTGRFLRGARAEGGGCAARRRRGTAEEGDGVAGELLELTENISIFGFVFPARG